jgi:hypothetical protein
VVFNEGRFTKMTVESPTALAINSDSLDFLGRPRTIHAGDSQTLNLVCVVMLLRLLQPSYACPHSECSENHERRSRLGFTGSPEQPSSSRNALLYSTSASQVRSESKAGKKQPPPYDRWEQTIAEHNLPEKARHHHLSCRILSYSRHVSL